MNRISKTLTIARKAAGISWALLKNNKYVTAIYIGSRHRHEDKIVQFEMTEARKKIERRLRAIRSAKNRQKDERGRFI